MVNDRVIHRRALYSLPLGLAVLAVFASQPTLGQINATHDASHQAESRDVEMQHQLVLSHRRREQILQNALYNQALTAEQQRPLTATTVHRPHRKINMHRGTTPQGRRAGSIAPAAETSQ